MHASQTSHLPTAQPTEIAVRLGAALNALAAFVRDNLASRAAQPRLPQDERLLRDIGLAPGDDEIARALAAADPFAAHGQSPAGFLARMKRGGL